MRVVHSAAIFCIFFTAFSSFGDVPYRERLTRRGEIKAPEATPQEDAEPQFADPVTNATIELVANGGFETNSGWGRPLFRVGRCSIRKVAAAPGMSRVERHRPRAVRA